MCLDGSLHLTEPHTLIIPLSDFIMSKTEKTKILLTDITVLATTHHQHHQIS